MRIKFRTRSNHLLGSPTPVLSLILILLAQFGADRSALGQSATYLVTELASGDGAQVPSKLNNLGVIVGRQFGGGKGGPRATLWDNSHSHGKHLGVLASGDYSSATGINDTGEIAGSSNAEAAILPFIWTEKGGLQQVPILPGDSSGQAVAINKHGDVAAYSSGWNGSRAFLWSRKGSVRELGTLAGGNYSKAHDLNDSDDVVGVSGSLAGDRAVLWTRDGNARDLGTLPGDFASAALAINNAGAVVGYSKGPNGTRAFLWTNSNGMEELGILPGGSSSRALAINDSGTVVGASTTQSGDHAFVWNRQTGMLDLNDAASLAPGTVLVEAHAINRKGEILAMGGMDPAGMAPDTHRCSPAPPLSLLLTPTNAP
jgi:probable HAF family extracellular repeat protein